MEKDYLILKRAAVSRPSGSPAPDSASFTNALWRPARPGLQSRGHDSEKLEVPRCEMRQKRQRQFRFCTPSLVDMVPTLKFAGTWRLARRQSCVLPPMLAPASADCGPALSWAGKVILQSGLKVLRLGLNCSGLSGLLSLRA